MGFQFESPIDENFYLRQTHTPTESKKFDVNRMRDTEISIRSMRLAFNRSIAYHVPATIQWQQRINRKFIMYEL